jgi:peptidoglycan L-alanyl-D-glutamate endopeptidase CwlK
MITVIRKFFQRIFGGKTAAAPAQNPAVKFDERSEKNIATLVPDAQEAARKWLAACLAAGFRVRIIDGSRTWADQDALYAKGRTAPGAIVTNARGGQSWHNFGLAWDFGIFGPAGEYFDEHPDYLACAKIAAAHGLESGAFWTGSLVDQPHVQLNPQRLTLAQMRDRYLSGQNIA